MAMHYELFDNSQSLIAFCNRNGITKKNIVQICYRDSRVYNLVLYYEDNEIKPEE